MNLRLTQISLLLLLVLLTVSAAFADVAKDRQPIGVLRQGYLTNRESFPLIDCNFEWREGKAATRQDALDGKWTGKTKTQLGHWLVDGSFVHYKLLCSPELVQETERLMREGLKKNESGAKTTAPTSVSIPCADRIFLRSDAYSLRYGPTNLSANLFSKTDRDPEGIRVTPFNPDCLGPDEYSSPARYMEEALNSRMKAKFGGTEKINGIEALVASFADGDRQKFGFDPKRGYLMVYASDTDLSSGKRYYEVNVLEARECSGGRWFPMRLVTILNPDSAGPYDVRELKVTRLDVDTKPSADKFRVTLPEGVQVSVIGRMEWMNITEPKSVTPQDLPGLQVRAKEVGDSYLAGQSAEAQVGGKSSGRRYIYVALGASLVFVLGCIVYYSRRRKNQLAPPGPSPSGES